jgi:hypothetical protein
VAEQGVDAPPAFNKEAAAFLPGLPGGGKRPELLHEWIGCGGYFAHFSLFTCSQDHQACRNFFISRAWKLAEAQLAWREF